MEVSPLRLAAALVFGGMVTGGLYLTQQANGRPLAPAKVERPAPPKPTKAAVPASSAPKRIVFRHTAPGDVVLTVHGDEVQVQFVPIQPPAVKKPPTKVSVLPSRPATPVATP